jgi:O-antigen ligase
VTTLAADLLLLQKDRPLPLKWLVVIGSGLCFFFVAGQFFFPNLILIGLFVAASIGTLMIRSGKTALYTFLIVVFGLAFRVTSYKGTDAIDILAGAAIGAILLAWTFRFLYLEGSSVTYSVPQLVFASFMLWAMLIGLGGLIWGNNSWNDWIREILIQCPLFIIPALYVRFFEAGSRSERKLERFAFGTAIVLMLWTVVKYASNVAMAVYAYQVGRMTFDPSTAVIVLLLCIAFTVNKVDWIPMYARYLLASLCIGTLILASYRTTWASTAFITIILFMLLQRNDRASGFKFLAVLFSILGAIATYLYNTMPMFKIYCMMTLNRLLSSTQLSTDASLVNRYIETDIVARYVADNPITGYGYGSHFQLWDWLLGFSMDTGYAHNGYYFTLFKTGIIGFILLYSAYLWFLRKGWQLARDMSLTPRARAIAAVTVCYLISMLINNYTLNIFAERNQLSWVALCWGFILAQEIAKNKRDASAKVVVPSVSAA